MREILVPAAVAALALFAPAAAGSAVPASPAPMSAAGVAAAVALVQEETCEERGYRTICEPRCRDLPLGGEWGSLDPPNKGECLAECTREVETQCSSQGG